MRSSFLCLFWLMGLLGSASGSIGEGPVDRPEVYVRESFQAREALGRLRELESESRWGEAAEGYDRLAEEAGGELVQVDPLHFRNVRSYVRERLLGWPAEARQRYGDMFSGRAAWQLERLKAPAPAVSLVALAERYWLTPAGKQAAQQAVLKLRQEGRIEAAGRWVERLEAEGAGDQLRSSGPQTRRDPTVADVGSEDPTYDSTYAWPMAGGNPSRGRIGAVVVEPGEVFWGVSLDGEPGRSGQQTRQTTAAADVGSEDPTYAFTPLNPPLLRGDEAGEMPAPPGAAATFLEPVVAGERVYVQSVGRLWAVGLNSGRVEWTVRPGEAEDEEATTQKDCGRGAVSPAWADGRVFANLTWCDGGRVGASRLVCVDATDGRVLWQVEASPRDLSGGFRPVEFFDGSPLVYEGRVYVVVRRRRELGFEDCRLACFDPATGQRLWDVTIASGPAGPAGGGQALAMTRSDPAGGGDDVFVQTNLGAMGCVDGLTGQVRWVTLDPVMAQKATNPLKPQRDRFLPKESSESPVGPILPQPVVVARLGPAFAATSLPVLRGPREERPAQRPAATGTRESRTGNGTGMYVLTVPAGSADLVGYEAENGRETYRLGRGELGDFRSLAGPAGGIVYAVGGRVIAYDLVGGKRRWDLDLQTLGGSEPLGRPFLSEDRLWVSTRYGLGWVMLDGNRRGQVSWNALHTVGEPHCAGGDVIVADGMFLVSGLGRLWCLGPAGGARTRLEARVDSSREDGAAWLDLARYALVRPGATDRGLEALDAAVACAAGAATTQLHPEQVAGQARQRALEVVLEAASRCTDARSRGDPDLLKKLLSRAADLARDPWQQVHYRLAFAQGFERLGMPREAVGLYQQVLNEGSGFGVQGSGWGRTSAGRVAERAIDRLIQRHGHAVYAECDAQAGRMLQAVLQKSDPAILAELLKRYPNSEAITDGLLAWIKLERRAGRSLAAVRCAQDLLRRRVGVPGTPLNPPLLRGDKAGKMPAPPGAARAAVIAQVVAGYFDAGDPLDGLAWLARGRREHGDEQWLDEGRAETFDSLRQRLVARGAEVQGDWPKLAPPLRKAYQLDRPHAILLQPQERSARLENVASDEPVLLFDEGRIEAFHSASGEPLWKASPISVGTPVWLGRRGELLLFSTRYQLFALDWRGGTVRWTVGTPPRLAKSPAVDPEIFTRVISWTLGETLAVVLLSDGRGVAVEVASGEVLWERALPRKAGGPCALNDEHLAYVAQGEPAALVVLEAASGREAGVLPLEQAGQVSWCGFSPMRTVLVAGSDWLACFDPYTKSRRWLVEGLEPNRAGLVLPGVNGFYAASETGVACRSYADAGVLWKRELSGLAGGAVMQAWLDAGRVYVLTERGAAAMDASTGQVMWAAQWKEDLAVGSAWLTERYILAVGVRQVQAEDGLRWELRACWLHRDTGRQTEADHAALGRFEAMPDVGVCGSALVVRAGPAITGWTNRSPDQTGNGASP